MSSSLKGVLFRLWYIVQLVLVLAAFPFYLVIALFVWIATGRDIVENPPKWLRT